MTSYHELLPIAVEAIEWASQIMRHRPPGRLTAKGDRDLVSDVDYQIERDLRTILRERTPDIGFLGEEEGAVGAGEMHWALDPVDGTINFTRGVPLCAISLGLIHKKRPVLGVIDLPFLGNRYTASEGEGAYVDGRKMKVSGIGSLGEAVVAIGDYAVGTDAISKNKLRLALTAKLVARVQRIRMTGTAALDLAWLADGKFDASITLSNHVWDMAAGVIIAREAGACVIDRDGKEHDVDSFLTLATTPELAADLLAEIIPAVTVATGGGP